MRMVKLTQIPGNGMHPREAIMVNPDHVMAVQPRNPKDGYGSPQTGSIVHMVTSWTFHTVETPDVVMRMLAAAYDDVALSCDIGPALDRAHEASGVVVQKGGEK